MLRNNFQKYYQENMDTLKPLFEEAFEKSEFNVIMSLLAFRGASDAGWEPYENTEDVFDEMGRQQNNFRYSLKTNMMLLLYVHVVECAENYELISNLINTVQGNDYIIANNKNKNYVNLTVLEKISRLKSKVSRTNHSNVHRPFEKTFDSRFRNAINHADYALKSSPRGGVTIIDDTGFPKLYNDQEVLDLINKALALQSCIKDLRVTYIGHYDKSVPIQSSASFGGGNSIEATLIVRKNHGVIGFRCIGGYDDGVPFETRLTKCFRYEQKMIDDGQNNLPKSRIERMNKILKIVPRKTAAKIAPFLEEHIVNR